MGAKDKKTGSADWTLKDMERSLAKRQALTLDLEEAINQLEQNIAALRKAFAPEMTELAIQIDQETKLQLAWMVAHKADFDGPPRSIELPFGTVGYRLGQPRLKPISKWNWEKVLENMLEIGQESFIRRTPEVDREALLAHKDEFGEDGLKAIGLKVVQDDNPFVEIKRDKTAAEIGEVVA